MGEGMEETEEIMKITYSALTVFAFIQTVSAISLPCGGVINLACMATSECTASHGASSTCAGGSTVGPILGCCTTTSTNTANCSDLINPRSGVSDCPRVAHLCDNTVYHDVMTVQCPKTCNRCSTAGGSTRSPISCVDLVNPRTNVSECPRRKALCTNAIYKPLMKAQCPATCGFC